MYPLVYIGERAAGVNEPLGPCRSVYRPIHTISAMQRRQFIHLAAAGAAAAALPGAGWAATAPRSAHALASPHLLTMLGSSETAAIGRAYRAAYPSERTADALSRAILSETGLPASSDEAQHGRLDEHVRRDFSSGRIVRLNGWILSRTEARQCALFSTLHT